MQCEKTAEKRLSASQVEAVVDFCVELGGRMIESGANLERVSLAVERVCHAYELTGISLYLLSTHISLGAKDADGRYAMRQRAIPPVSNHLERLKKLNRLSYDVVAQTPDSRQLAALLEEASACGEQKESVTLLAQVCAMSCLCLIFGGGYREVISVVIVTAIMHGVMNLLARPGLDKIVTNAATMWTATAFAIVLVDTGISTNGSVILITVSMLVIPGIPLVNAARNLLCGNEMNGILQMLKAIIETAALAAGIYLALIMFGKQFETSGEVTAALSAPIPLVLISFAASVSFGAVFRIQPRDLVLAGFGGALSRAALIFLSSRISSRLVYMAVAALVASLYAELLATRRKDPSTYFVYPSIIPLIPGDLFYYCLEGLFIGDRGMSVENGVNCLLALLGMSIGFVLSSIIAHYIRKVRFRRVMKK